MVWEVIIVGLPKPTRSRSVAIKATFTDSLWAPILILNLRLLRFPKTNPAALSLISPKIEGPLTNWETFSNLTFIKLTYVLIY